MARIVQEIPDGSIIVDCVTRVMTVERARALKADGVDGVIQYVGKMSSLDPGLLKSHVDAIMAGGLGFLGMCFADQFDGAYRAKLFADAGAIPGTPLGADLESYHKSAVQCRQALIAFHRDVQAALFFPYLYQGNGQPLDGNGIGSLPFTRYHKSASEVPMPMYDGTARGWSLIQKLGDPRDPRVDWRHVMRGGINVDINEAQPDALGRRLSWMIEVPDAPETIPDLSLVG
jgi:hypothetical protein